MRRNELIRSILQNIGSMARLGAGRTAHGAWPKGMPTQAQLGIMFMLSHRKMLGIKELAEGFGISSSAATQLVNGLVADGLLRRNEHKKDRRSVRIELTAKGKKKLVAAKIARMKMLAKMYEPLSDKELAQYLKLQKKIANHFQRT